MKPQRNYPPMLEPKELLKKYAYPYLPEDEIFRANFIKVTVVFFYEMEKEKGDVSTKEDRFPTIDLYKKLKIEFNKGHSLGSKLEKILDSLEVQAVTYLITLVAKNAGVDTQDLLKKLEKIEKTSAKLLDTINSIAPVDKALLVGALSEPDVMSLGEMVRGESTQELNPEEFFRNSFFNRADQMRKELMYCSKIRSRFIETSAGKWLQLGSSGPKENSALTLWIRGLAEIWTNDLGRSLSFTKDPTAGREKFLNFAESCMEPLHPEILNTDTIRNTFEKLRQNGKFDYLSEISSELV